jgi:bifunctional non-homologous end joining protein LigD
VTEVDIAGRRLRLTSLDKVLWPATGFTKGEMIDYYRRVAPALVPHLAGRPLTLGRFPDGVDGPGFAQTECRGRPEWMRTAPLTLRSGEIRSYCVVDDEASLVWVANLGTIELHPYLARGETPEQPTLVALDIDPSPPGGLVDSCRASLRLRDALAEDGLAAFPKTSGAAGLHVYVPLNSPLGYDETRAFARGLAERLAGELPDGRARVDWRQNAPRRSTVAPYSLRAMDRPSVSTPVSWEEVEEVARDRREPAFAPAEVLARVDRDGDLFRPVLELEQSLAR